MSVPPGGYRLQNRYQDGGWEWLKDEAFTTEDAAIDRAIECASDAIAYGMLRVIGPDGLEVVTYAAGEGNAIKAGERPRKPLPPRKQVGTFMGLPVFTKTFQECVADELARARAKHGAVHGLHEGYAVLLEEVDEFWDEVKKKTPDKANAYLELVQIAAMAQKIAEDVLS